MKYRILFLFAAFNLIATFCCIYGQTKIVWTKTFGGGKSDQIYWVEQTSDKGFILAGETKSFGAGDSDAWLIRLNKKGDTVWSRTYGGPRNDFAEGVIEMKDGGFVFAGGTRSFGAGNADVWIVRTNKYGDTLWTKTWGGAGDEWGEEIRLTLDGGFVIPGWTTSSRGDYDAVLIKLDKDGNIQWSHVYGGPSLDAAKSVIPLLDGFMIAGITRSFGAGDADAWIIRTNLSGDTLWTKTYGGAKYDMPFCIIQTADKNFAFTGRTHSFGHSEGNSWLYIINSQGDSLWTNTYGGKEYEVTTFVEQTFDKGFILCGITKSFGAGEFDAYVVKTNKMGDTSWTKTFGGTKNDYSYCIKQINRHEFVIAGTTDSFGAGESDGWLIRFRLTKDKSK